MDAKEISDLRVTKIPSGPAWLIYVVKFSHLLLKDVHLHKWNMRQLETGLHGQLEDSNSPVRKGTCLQIGGAAIKV